MVQTRFSFLSIWIIAHKGTSECCGWLGRFIPILSIGKQALSSVHLAGVFLYWEHVLKGAWLSLYNSAIIFWNYSVFNSHWLKAGDVSIAGGLHAYALLVAVCISSSVRETSWPVRKTVSCTPWWRVEVSGKSAM